MGSTLIRICKLVRLSQPTSRYFYQLANFFSCSNYDCASAATRLKCMQVTLQTTNQWLHPERVLSLCPCPAPPEPLSEHRRGRRQQGEEGVGADPRPVAQPAAEEHRSDADRRAGRGL